MMEALEERGRLAGARAAGAARARVAAAVRDGVGGVSIAETGDGVVISGRGLSARLAEDPALRWIAGLLR